MEQWCSSTMSITPAKVYTKRLDYAESKQVNWLHSTEKQRIYVA